MPISQNLDLISFSFLQSGPSVPIFFLASFFSFFQDLLLSIPFVLHILSGYHKKLGVNYGQSLEMGLKSIIGIVGRFTTIFVPKSTPLFFNLLRQNAVDIQKLPLRG